MLSDDQNHLAMLKILLKKRTDRVKEARLRMSTNGEYEY